MKTYSRFGPLSFYKRAAAIAAPVTLQTLVQNMVSLVDNFMVAGLGDLKMSGVNATNQFMFLYLVILNVLSVASGIFMSQFNGTGDKEGMGQAFRFKVFSGVTLAVLMMVASLAFPDALLSLLLKQNEQRSDIVAAGVPYFRTITFTFIPVVLSTAIASSFRETGRVIPPLLISVLATLVNTFFNWVFIYGNLGAPRLETVGAAIATVIARVVELIVFIAFALRARPAFLVRASELFRVNISLFLAIVRKSGLIFLSEITWGLTEVIVNFVYYGRGGAEIVSGLSAAWAIANVFFTFNGIYTATGVIIGGELGRGELDEARRDSRWMLNGSIVFGLGLGILEACSTALIPVVFGNLSAEARGVCRTMIFVISAYLPIWTYINTQFAVARSGGDAVMGAWVDVGVNTVLFLPGLFLLAYLTGLGPVEMYGIVKLTDFAKIAIAAWQLKKERWVKKLT